MSTPNSLEESAGPAGEYRSSPARYTALCITVVTRIRLCLSRGDNLRGLVHAYGHMVVCGNKTIPVCPGEVMWAGGARRGVDFL